MAQLWGGRFTEKTDDLAYDFNASLRFDIRLLPQDIRGSIAHASMLGKQGILTEKEARLITDELARMASDHAAGVWEIDPEAEDVHSLVEAELIRRIGESGKKLHTGRSRNDQVATDMRLYVRDTIDALDGDLIMLLSVLLTLMEEHAGTVMPGFTHMQKAQPITLGHHLGAYFEMFRRDRERLASVRQRMNVCPLGSGALAGTTYDLDREYAAKLLGFDGITRNSLDGVSDRDYLIDFLSALSVIMMHLSRFSEEIITWASDEYRFIELSDAYSTGSSLMPQKKNPDIAELIRGKCGRVYGHLTALLTTMKGIPLAYNKDMQEDKEGTFDAADTVRSCLSLFAAMLKTAKFREERMRLSAAGGFTNATDAADYLVRKGVPFRDAHGMAGQLVLLCIEKGITLEELPLSEWKSICPLVEDDVYEAIRPETCIRLRKIPGAPGMIRDEIAEAAAYLGKDRKN